MYRECDEPLITTNADMWFATKEYLLLCLQHMEFDSTRWIKLIEIADYFRDDLWVKIFEQLEYEITFMNDPEVIAIKDKIRDEIYRHRYFANSEYHSLNHVYQQLIDYYKTYAERIGKTKDTTIDSESHSGSVFFYHLQQRGCCNLESTE